MANSFDASISDPVERYTNLFDRCFAAGKGALLIKCADIFDNLPYYSCITDKSQAAVQRRKVQHFINVAEEVLRDDFLYKQLVKRFTSF